MDLWVQTIVTVVCSVLASSGLWTFLIKRSDKKDAKTELLRGIAHDRIIFLGASYVKRGYITKEEYENLHVYLYEPYVKTGKDEHDVDATVERMMKEVEKLPMQQNKSAILADLSQR